jgi:hypothetical protein
MLPFNVAFEQVAGGVHREGKVLLPRRAKCRFDALRRVFVDVETGVGADKDIPGGVDGDAIRTGHRREGAWHAGGRVFEEGVAVARGGEQRAGRTESGADYGASRLRGEDALRAGGSGGSEGKRERCELLKLHMGDS